MRVKLRGAGAVCALACILTGCTITPNEVRDAAGSGQPPISINNPATPGGSSAHSLTIESVSNFRDVAGSAGGLPLSDGALMAQGVVYRSGRLRDLSTKDRAALVRIGLSDIFDLRTEEVATRSPDPEIDGVDYHLINLYALYSKITPTFTNTEEALAERREINRDFVAAPEQRARTAAVLRGIANAPGPVIVHCTEGKDRTGWIAALLQLIAGADEDVVVKEYLLSNDYRRDLIEEAVAETRLTKGTMSAEIARLQLEVDAAYLSAGLEELVARYGHLQGFLTQGLGLESREIDALRSKLREG